MELNYQMWLFTRPSFPNMWPTVGLAGLLLTDYSSRTGGELCPMAARSQGRHSPLRWKRGRNWIPACFSWFQCNTFSGGPRFNRKDVHVLVLTRYMYCYSETQCSEFVCFLYINDSSGHIFEVVSPVCLGLHNTSCLTLLKKAISKSHGNDRV